MRKTVLVPIADGTEELEAVTIIDVLRRAGAQVTVASVNDWQITASRNTKLTADALIADCAGQTYDLIALPGGMPGAEHLRDSDALIALLRQQRDAGRLYAAICASPAVVFQPHGLLTGRRATCYPDFQSKLDPANVVDEPVVVDGQCVTSQGPGTALNFALKLVELLFDADQAQKVAGAMLAA
jgi:protein deglycase